MTEALDQKTHSRAALDPGFERNRQQLDWMHVPGMATYVNKMVSGRSPKDGGHWCTYTADKFIKPLSQRLSRHLSMVSLGCGTSRVEEGVISRHGWPISSYCGMEYDSKLRQAGAERFAAYPHVTADMRFLDFNDTAAAHREKFDIVFCHHAIHHATDVEGLLPFINEMMHDHSLLIGSEFLGPTRFQVSVEARDLINRLDAVLPDELRMNLKTGKVGPVEFATLKRMRYDPSESARSADLRAMLFANFPIIERRPMGGTLLRWLFQYRAGNFDKDNPYHVSIAQLLIKYEQKLIEEGIIQSDDMFFVLGKSAVL